MRAYFAVLKDSFREALASRVLLIALIAILAVLALIAPFGLHEDKALELRRTEVPQPARLLQSLADGETATGSPAGHIWTLLSDEQRDKIAEWLDPDSDAPIVAGRGNRSGGRQVIREVNELLKQPEFYDAEAWSDVALPEEAEALIAEESLNEDELRRRNLLLLAAAFPRSIRIIDSTSLSVTYANASVLDALPITPSQFRSYFETALVAVIAVFLGFFGVFASLLVTANVIPRTFEAGEISLLLSKPIRRSGLFITKFIGGCVFTLLYATVMVVGLWLLLGIRIDYWNSSLLWCIPVYVLLFMIYYAVSALAGAIWRNSIVSLSLVVCFWVTITVVGEVHEQMQKYLIGTRGIKEIIPAGDELLVVDGEQKTYRWDDSRVEWEEVFEASPLPGIPNFLRRQLQANTRFLPAYDATRQQLLALQQVPARFGGMAPPELQAGTVDDAWSRNPLGRLPDFASTILVSKAGDIIVPCQEGVYQFVGQSDKERQQGDFISNMTAGLFGNNSKAFRNLLPDGFPALSGEFAAAMDYASSDLVVHGSGELIRLAKADDGTYQEQARRSLDDDSSAALAVGGTHCVLATASGQIMLVDRETLTTKYEMALPEGVVPRVCAADRNGDTLAVLTHDETILLFDGNTATPLEWTPPENGVCTAIAFAPDGELLVSDGRLAVRQYNLSTRQAVMEWSQATTWVYQFYDYLIVPAWTVLPKPRELDQFVPYVMTGKSTILDNEQDGPPGGVNRESLQQDRSVFDARRVLRDNFAFIFVMLALGCFYISRRDF
jgi:ABC-type transport system involved in multi-copper enzyme maturation permease subunit